MMTITWRILWMPAGTTLRPVSPPAATLPPFGATAPAGIAPSAATRKPSSAAPAARGMARAAPVSERLTARQGTAGRSRAGVAIGVARMLVGGSGVFGRARDPAGPLVGSAAPAVHGRLAPARAVHEAVHGARRPLRKVIERDPCRG